MGRREKVPSARRHPLAARPFCATVKHRPRPQMSEERAEKFLELFNKGKEFTEELLKENQRLRFRVASLESQAGGVSSDELQRLRSEMAQLAEENKRL